MEVILINEPQAQAFESFIPSQWLACVGKKNYVFLGLVEYAQCFGALGAEIGKNNLEIMFLALADNCWGFHFEDQLLGTLMNSIQETSLWTVHYMATGANQRLACLDQAFTKAGFQTEISNTQVIRASLKEIAASPWGEKAGRMGKDPAIFSGKQLPASFLQNFNRSLGNILDLGGLALDVSFFYLENKRISACMVFREEAGSVLVNEYFYNVSAHPKAALNVIFAALRQVLKQYPLETQVLLAPSNPKLMALAARFGFSEQSVVGKVHQYQYER